MANPASRVSASYANATVGALPFVRIPRRVREQSCYWRVPPTNDYGLACDIGRECAAHYVQYLKDNPRAAGLNTLGRIAADINFRDESGAKGYWVGFFSHLERLICAQANRMDVFEDLARVNAVVAQIAAQRANEARMHGDCHE